MNCNELHTRIAERSMNGLHTIVDHCLVHPVWTENLANVLGSCEIMLIGVHCSLEELERREKMRNTPQDYRENGTARGQLQTVHDRKVYDFEINTTQLHPVHAREQIVKYIKTGTSSGLTTRKKLGV